MRIGAMPWLLYALISHWALRREVLAQGLFDGRDWQRHLARLDFFAANGEVYRCSCCRFNLATHSAYRVRLSAKGVLSGDGDKPPTVTAGQMELARLRAEVVYGGRL